MNNIILKDTEGKIITSNEVECKIYSQSDYIKILPGTVGKSIKNDKIGNEYECDIFEVSLDRSLSKVDKLDIEIAIVSGVLSGLVDSFFIGKFSLDEANEWGDKKVEEFVIHVAKKKGCKGEDIFDAIKFLEEKFPLPSDNLKYKFGGAKWHHLKDFSHHFSLLGLAFSIISQFTKKAYGVDVNGAFIAVDIKNTELLGRNFHEKVLFGSVNWFFHMVSDMAGSSNNPGKGTGIPGPIVSLIRQCSALPIFKKLNAEKTLEFNKWINHLFFGTYFGDRDENGKIINPKKFDFRTEFGILGQLGKQTVPVIMNECIISSFYTVRRLINEIKECHVKSIKDLQKIDPKDILPFGTDSIRNMRTIGAGVFVIVDMTDAAIRAGIECGGVNPAFAVDFLVHVNVVGVGRFVVALGSELSEIRKEAKNKKKIYTKELDKFEKALSGFESISLTDEQTNILYSMQKICIEKDITSEKYVKRAALKKEWLNKWIDLISKNNPKIKIVEEEVLLDIANNPNRQNILDLPIIHFLSFNPYCAIGSERDKQYTKLKLMNDYLEAYFCNKQIYLTTKDIKELKKSYEKTYEYINGSSKKKNISTIATVATVGLTGAASFIFAPVIAPIAAGVLFTDTIAGLSGAALINASLAAFGGGSLAAGGFGMAGGAIAIAGGGVAAGAIGAGGANALITMMSKESEALILEKTVHTVVFCREILDKRMHKRNEIINILESFNNQIDQLDSLKRKLSLELKESTDKKIVKTKIKIIKNNIKTIDNGRKLLEKMVPRSARK